MYAPTVRKVVMKPVSFPALSNASVIKIGNENLMRLRLRNLSRRRKRVPPTPGLSIQRNLPADRTKSLRQMKVATKRRVQTRRLHPLKLRHRVRHLSRDLQRTPDVAWATLHALQIKVTVPFLGTFATSFHVCVNQATVENVTVGTMFSRLHRSTCIQSGVCMHALTASRSITFDPRNVACAAMTANGFSL